MPAGIFNFTGEDRLEQGSALRKTFIYEDSEGAAVDLTGYTARMQVRKHIKSADVLLELTTENGGFTIEPMTGTIHMDLTEEVAEALTWRTGFYDIELIPPSGEAFRFLQGEIEVDPEVTRPEAA